MILAWSLPTNGLFLGVATLLITLSNQQSALAHPATNNTTSDNFLAAHPWQAPGPDDARSPCPFINTMANHDLIPRNGMGVDLFQMTQDMEDIFSLAADFTNVVAMNVINCGQTFVDDAGVIRLDIDRLFEPECEEHEGSLVRQDNFFGFEESKLVDDTLLNNLMRVNPTSRSLTLDDIIAYQTERVIDSRTRNPETVYGEFDILNSAAQAITLMMLGTDADLQIVSKERVYTLLLLEQIPEGFVPGAIRDTPFNFLDPTDPANAIFQTFVNNVNQTQLAISFEGSESASTSRSSKGSGSKGSGSRRRRHRERQLRGQN